LRAARSITKTKSVSGNFIVKTTISKSNNKPYAEEKDASNDNIISCPRILNDASSPNIVNLNDYSTHASPTATEKSTSKYFLSM
jgi:hypothetical protein